jgi:predicted extracellular nuclease
VTLPVASINDFERYEGMLVRFLQNLVIAEYFNYDRFGEMVIALPLSGETRPFTGTAIDEPGAPALDRAYQNSLRRITLDDGLNTENPAILRHPNGAAFALDNRFRGGDTVQNTVGILTYGFDLYRIQPTGPATYNAVNPRPASPEPVGGTVRVAAMNTLNFFVTLDPSGGPGDNQCGPANTLECRGADDAGEFTRQRDKLLTALAGLDADVIGLNELENSTGVEPMDSIVSGMPGYAYINTGTIGTDAIKVGLIYRPAVVTPVGAYQILDSTDDPRFIDTKSRPSLAQTFEVNATSARFTVVVNHLKSKGSACVDVGDPDLGDGQGNCSQTRRAAAEALVDWLATDPTGSGDLDFIIMGDLNSYAQEDTIDEIKAGSDDVAGTGDDFTNLIAHFQGTFAYSYTFDGQAGYLDHALANTSLFQQITGAADWHINSDEPDILDYDTTFKPPSQDALYEVNAYRTSDHDPVVVGLELLHYNFSGFFQPVDNTPVLNVAKAGSSIPVKFSLNGFQGLDIFLVGYPLSYQISCDTNAAQDSVEQTVNAGGSSLSYDSNADQYNYVWKTEKSWAGTCRQLVVILKDGSIHLANFQFKK